MNLFICHYRHWPAIEWLHPAISGVFHAAFCSVKKPPQRTPASVRQWSSIDLWMSGLTAKETSAEYKNQFCAESNHYPGTKSNSLNCNSSVWFSCSFPSRASPHHERYPYKSREKVRKIVAAEIDRRYTGVKRYQHNITGAF